MEILARQFCQSYCQFYSRLIQSTMAKTVLLSSFLFGKKPLCFIVTLSLLLRRCISSKGEKKRKAVSCLQNPFTPDHGGVSLSHLVWPLPPSLNGTLEATRRNSKRNSHHFCPGVLRGTQHPPLGIFLHIPPYCWGYFWEYSRKRERLGANVWLILVLLS